MKERELRERAVCSICGNKIGKAGPTFWTIKAEGHILDFGAIQRQQGLGLMIGGALAMHIGPDDDMTQTLRRIDITVCQSCFDDSPLSAIQECSDSE